MKTLVNLVLEIHGDRRNAGENIDVLYLMEGVLDAAEAEEKLRDAIDQFFSRAGESYIRAAWDDSCGDFNWGDAVLQDQATMYFEANGIFDVGPKDPIVAEAHTTVIVDHDELLFPEEWAKKMEAIDQMAEIDAITGRE